MDSYVILYDIIKVIWLNQRVVTALSTHIRLINCIKNRINKEQKEVKYLSNALCHINQKVYYQDNIYTITSIIFSPTAFNRYVLSIVSKTLYLELHVVSAKELDGIWHLPTKNQAEAWK